MILEYTCENYKSIKEKIMFSMLASSDNSFKEKLIPFSNIFVNRTASIYGANGSGKTSFMESLRFLCLLVTNSNNHQPGDKIRQLSHKLSEKNAPTTYTIQFTKDDVRYAYGLSYTEGQIISEYLYHFPNGKQAKIFDRKHDSLNYGDKFKKTLESITSFSKPNKLFLSVAANYCSIEEVLNVFLFFKEDIIFYPQPLENNQWLNYSIKNLSSNEMLRDLFVKFMNRSGSTIKNLHTNYEETTITPDQLPKELPAALKELLMQSDGPAIKVEADIDYGLFSVGLNEESKGTQKLFEIIGPLIDIIIKNKILIWDEIETSLHPFVVNNILDLVYTKKDSTSQLIFSTHNTNLLDLTRFRRDQIWFAELTESRSTDLYSLAELKSIRKDENIQKGYLNGKYGAIPFEYNPLKFIIEEV